jgi:hypothetical protein
MLTASCCAGSQFFPVIVTVPPALTFGVSACTVTAGITVKAVVETAIVAAEELKAQMW